MKRLAFDPYEFEHHHSEEYLEVATAPRRQFATASAFVVAWRGEEMPVLEKQISPALLLLSFEQLRRFADVVVSEAEARIYVLSDDWDDRSWVAEGIDRYVGYHWYTTA